MHEMASETKSSHVTQLSVDTRRPAEWHGRDSTVGGTRRPAEWHGCDSTVGGYSTAGGVART